MNSPAKHRVICVSFAVVSLLCGSIAAAADVTAGAFGIKLSREASNAQTIKITGPNGYSSESSGDSMQSLSSEPLADGIYKFEVIETQCVNISYAEIQAAARDNAANGRDENTQPSNCRDLVVDSGAFRIVNGAAPSRATAEE